MRVTAFLAAAIVIQPVLGQDSQSDQGVTSWQELVRANNAEAVVYIEANVTDKTGDPDHPLVYQNTGTGFIVSADGFVITCRHVVPENGGNVSVEAFAHVDGAGGQKYSLHEVDPLPRHDLVLMQLEERLQGWPSIQTQARPRVGAQVVALGYYDRRFFTVPGSIENKVGALGHWNTDAQLNPGMSGGPVFDSTLGVAAIIRAGDKAAQGVTELIPISFANSLLVEAASPIVTKSSQAVQRTAKIVAKARDQLDEVNATRTDGDPTETQISNSNASLAQAMEFISKWNLLYNQYVDLNRNNPAPKSSRARYKILAELKDTADQIPLNSLQTAAN